MKLSSLILTICLGFCSISLLSGCVILSKEKMADGSTDYNKVVEKAQNEMLLLNIVRASKRSPMYFTDFNAMRGDVTYNFQTGSLNIPFGKIGNGLDGSYSIAPSAGFTTNPNFDLTLNDSQDFTNGIMTPISMKTFNYYWEMGWPKEMLLHLFIRRIEKIDAAGKVEEAESVDNDPDDKDEFIKFQIKLREVFFTKDKCTIVKRTKEEKIGPELSEKDASALESLIEVKKAGYKLQARECNKFQLIAEEESYEFACEQASLLLAGSLNNEEDKKEKYNVYLRSPEAIIYYLGEMVRAETENDFEPTIHVCESKPSSDAPLFVAHETTDNKIHKIPSVMVDYEGAKYVISQSPPGTHSCQIDRSMHVLSLVSQLIGLQKKGEKTPVTGVVHIPGGR